MKNAFLWICAILVGAAWGIGACAHAPRTTVAVPPSLATQSEVRVPARLRAQDILQTARAYLGTRYHFGGNQNRGTDCSGFTQLVFRRHGVALPHSAQAQAHFGLYIADTADLQPGDLVFFETYRKGPSHVGIYIGDNRFIHASKSRNCVVITSLKSKYYAKRFLGAKRLLADDSRHT